jgi:hypothetical protein
MEMDTTDLIARARDGDHDAFRDLVQSHTQELQGAVAVQIDVIDPAP